PTTNELPRDTRSDARRRADRIDSLTRHWVKVGAGAGLLLGGVVAYACTTDTAIGPDVAIDSLYIEPGNAVIFVGDTLFLTAVGVDTSGRRFADARVTWSATRAAIELEPAGRAVGVTTGNAAVRGSGGGLTAT